MNERSHNKLMHLAECTKITAGNPSEWNAKLYCEDHRLSLHSPGTVISVLKIGPKIVTPLSTVDVEFVIDYCGTFVNLEGTSLSLNQNQRHTKRSLLESAGYAQGLLAIKDSVIKANQRKTRKKSSSDLPQMTTGPLSDNDVWAGVLGSQA